MAVTINASTSAGLVQTADTSGVLQFQTNGTATATIDGSGNVGIGTSSPVTYARQTLAGGNLWVSAGTTNQHANWSSFNYGIAFPDASGNPANGPGALITATGVSSYGADLQFITRAGGGGAAVERMRIDSSGNVCVGTTSPYLSSIMSLQSSSSTNSRITQNIYNSAATSTTKIANSIIRVSSNASGADCCVAFTDNVANNYYFGGNNGGAYVMANSNGVRLSNGGTSWASDSDERVKDIIEPIENAIEKVSTLRTVIGKYKTDEEGTRRSFLIAQDVQAVLPEAVVAQDDEIGTLSLAYTDVIPLLTAAIQEQQTIINDLKARIETLEAK